MCRPFTNCLLMILVRALVIRTAEYLLASCIQYVDIVYYLDEQRE